MEHRSTGPTRDETTRASGEDGAVMVEYGFVMMLIAIAATVSVLKFGVAVRGLFESAAAIFPSP